jgi:pyrophosphatase PpaX
MTAKPDADAAARCRRFAAVLFDVDGTLLDSTDFIVGAVEHTLRSQGRTPPSRDRIASVLGPALADCYRVWCPDLDPVLLCRVHRAWQVDHVRDIHPYPGAADCLRALRSAGVRVAAVTARSKLSSLGSLDHTGLAGLIEFTVSAEDVTATKPDPEALHLALERLGVRASDAVMVGDTTADIRAGQAAGTATIGVLYGFHGARLASCDPDHLVRDIAEVTPIVLGENGG